MLKPNNNPNTLRQICKTGKIITNLYGTSNQFVQTLTADNLFIIMLENGKCIIESEGKAVAFDGLEVTYYSLSTEVKER